jgi:Domain of unknown function (DUF4062)
MRVFVSSVRKGLEEERDALPGLITAVGHTVVRFEDFSAQNEPSREACLKGVAESDIYILILGPRYGHRFPDTGQSPTHEEWAAATAAGKIRAVYRKLGVQFDPEQQELSREIGNYTSGVFHDSFSTTSELLTKVAAKLRELENASSALRFERLGASPSIEWRADFQRGPRLVTTSTPMVEVHVVPIDNTPYSSRIMVQLSDSLIDRIRRSRIVDSGTALELSTSEDKATVAIPISRPHSWNDARDGEIAGVRLAKSGQVSTWATLPTDSMGSIIDPMKLPDQIASMLRFIGALNLIDTERIVIGAGVAPVNMLTVDRFDEYRSRTTAYGLGMSDKPLRIMPDESVSRAALNTGAAEVSGHLARTLIERFRSRR